MAFKFYTSTFETFYLSIRREFIKKVDPKSERTWRADDNSLWLEPLSEKDIPAIYSIFGVNHHKYWTEKRSRHINAEKDFIDEPAGAFIAAFNLLGYKADDDWHNQKRHLKGRLYQNTEAEYLYSLFLSQECKWFLSNDTKQRLGKDEYPDKPKLEKFVKKYFSAVCERNYAKLYKLSYDGMMKHDFKKFTELSSIKHERTLSLTLNSLFDIEYITDQNEDLYSIRFTVFSGKTCHAFSADLSLAHFDMLELRLDYDPGNKVLDKKVIHLAKLMGIYHSDFKYDSWLMFKEVDAYFKNKFSQVEIPPNKSVKNSEFEVVEYLKLEEWKCTFKKGKIFLSEIIEFPVNRPMYGIRKEDM